jgi:hypothetical protein
VGLNSILLEKESALALGSWITRSKPGMARGDCEISMAQDSLGSEEAVFGYLEIFDDLEQDRISNRMDAKELPNASRTDLGREKIPLVWIGTEAKTLGLKGAAGARQIARWVIHGNKGHGKTLGLGLEKNSCIGLTLTAPKGISCLLMSTDPLVCQQIH